MGGFDRQQTCFAVALSNGSAWPQTTHMTITPIIPNLYQISIPTPFPVGPVNVYLATEAQSKDRPHQGDSLTLVDTGPRTDQARAALENGLASLGYSLAKIERIIITHAHTDHYGLAGDISRISGASVYSHPRNRPMLADHAAEREKRRAFFNSVLTEAGIPLEDRTTIVQALGGFRRFATAVSPVHTLDEGDRVQLAGKRWRVLFMPGHAGGLICLYQPESRLFLSNDHLLRDISSNPLFEPPLPGQTRRRRSLVDYIASLERTATIDIAVAWPGHGEPIYHHRTLIKTRLAFHRRRANKLLDALQDGPQTLYALSHRIFNNLKTMDRFLAVSEVLAHLEWLEDQGAVTCQKEEGVVFWSIA
jgi:glyoxylase-like metal-dependent hydrolase (beta-lactamase superfamily II)